MGLSIHFVCWWILTAWFYTEGFGWTIWSCGAPIAPMFLGLFNLGAGHDWLGGDIGILASLALMAGTGFALQKGHGHRVLIAHLAVLVYWLTGFMLIAGRIAQLMLWH
jgi:hypothetical protein